MQATSKVERGGQSIWQIDPQHTSVTFSVTNLFVFKVRGSFPDLAGTIVLDEADIHGSSVEARLKAASISTKNRQRDAHLRGRDFLDVERYPEILFRSTKVEPGIDRDTLKVTGELTIKDKTRPVVLAVEVIDRSRSPQGEEVVYYTATTKLNRFHFGVKGAALITGRELAVVINVQAVR